MSREPDTVTFIVDSPIEGGLLSTPAASPYPASCDRDEQPPRFAAFLAAAMFVGAAMGAVLWAWLAIRLAFFSPVE